MSDDPLAWSHEAEESEDLPLGWKARKHKNGEYTLCSPATLGENCLFVCHVYRCDSQEQVVNCAWSAERGDLSERYSACMAKENSTK